MTAHIGDGTVLEIYSWRQWPSLPSPVDALVGEDDLEDEDVSSSGSLADVTGSPVDRVEIGVRRYNLHDTVDVEDVV